MQFPEIWASPEPTVARLDAATVRDQLVQTGHEARETDLARLASLGIRAARYPVLWEKTAPSSPDRCDFTWAQRRLEGLSARGVEPIVTLLHHGSGPLYTDLLDAAFPALFARYALEAARRFPWVKRWTPINEPLTTARFSTLYATWYPNRFFDHAAFGRAIVNEARAIAGAMHAIRTIVPDARLLLTEDLQGFVAADAGVADYVRHKQERAFLSCELLMGRLVPGHPLYAYLRETCGVKRDELEAIAADPCVPDCMGYNYYPNSERFLASDGAGGHRNLSLVDVDPAALDMQRLLEAAYARLRLPLALSEVHVIGSERERARWMLQRFADVQAVRARGVDVRAFGAWAAFGMIDWMSLLCRNDGCVEDGVYTCVPADQAPRATMVADVVRALAKGIVPAMPSEGGWWERGTDAAVA